MNVKCPFVVEWVRPDIYASGNPKDMVEPCCSHCLPPAKNFQRPVPNVLWLQWNLSNMELVLIYRPPVVEEHN